MDDLRLIKPLPEFVIPGLVCTALFTGLFGVLSAFQGFDSVGQNRSKAVAQAAALEQKLTAHTNRREELESYEANGLHEIDDNIHMSQYWCSSGEKPWNPLTNAMVITRPTKVYDMDGQLVGWVSIARKFEVNEDCWKKEK